MQPYASHTAANTAIDATITDEVDPRSVSGIDVGQQMKQAAAMIGAIVKKTAAGVVTYYAPATRTGSVNDNDLWFQQLETLLEGAGSGDTYYLPPVVFQPKALNAEKIVATADDLTIVGRGCTIKRGQDTPTGVGVYFLDFSGDNLFIENIILDGNGTDLEDAEGSMVITRANAVLRNCRFTDPIYGATDSFHVRHWPSTTTQDRLVLDGCRFTDAGYGTFGILQGSMLATNCTFEILNDLNGSGIWDSFPQQRIVNVSVNDGYRVSDVIFEGCRFYTAKTAGSGAGGMALSGDQKVEELDEMHAAVDGNDHTGGNAITTDITDPDAREAGFTNSPCIVSATAGGNAANISRVAPTITGVGPNGNPITETLPPFQEGVAGTVYSQQFFAKVSQIDMPAHAAADAETKFGFLPNKIDNIIFRDCVQIFERYELGHYCKWQAVHNVLYDGHRIEHLSDNLSGQYGAFRWQKGTGRVTMRNVLAPARLSSLVGDLREMIIESSNFDFRSHPYNYFIEGAEDILHLDIRDTLIQGFTQYCVFNTSTGSEWPDYDEHATITFNHVQMRAIPTPNAYVLAYVPRIGFFRCGGYRDLNQPATPGESDKFYLADTAVERLMATVHDGDPRCAYYGRRLDAPGVMTGKGTGGAITWHPVVADSASSDAFPGVTGSKGDRIWNDLNGTGEQDGDPDSDSGIVCWIHNGTEWVSHISVAT